MKLSFSRLVLFLMVLPIYLAGQNTIVQDFYVAQWNVENLFDAVDDSEKDDSEFLPESDKNWTEGKLEQKLTNLARVINFMNDGKGPDVLSVQEIENVNVLERLKCKFRDRDYAVAHRESPDVRGIDVGLFYDRNVFDFKAMTKIEVKLPNKYPTRDILHVTLEHTKTKEVIHFFVNHWPSRRGGKEKSDDNREAAAKTLRMNIDSLLVQSPVTNIILLGDFNDGPKDVSIYDVLKTRDFDCEAANNQDNLLSLSYKMAEKKEGSYLFYGQWDMIDQIIISSGLCDGKGIEYSCDSFQVIKPEFMIIQSGSRKGGALPTFMGKVHSGGFSDHFPVGAKFYIK